jgi:hypothetical protein
MLNQFDPGGLDICFSGKFMRIATFKKLKTRQKNLPTLRPGIVQQYKDYIFGFTESTALLIILRAESAALFIILLAESAALFILFSQSQPGRLRYL